MGVSEPITLLPAKRKAQALHQRLGKYAFVKENKKNISVKEICKVLEIYGLILFPANKYFFKVTRNIQLQSIEPANVEKLDHLPNLFFWFKSMKLAKFPFKLFLIAWSASTLWQNSCKARCLQKNICCGVYSYFNLNFKIFKCKVKNFIRKQRSNLTLKSRDTRFRRYESILYISPLRI